MLQKFKSDLIHRINVYSWEKNINKEAKELSKVLGIPKGSYLYQNLLQDLANGNISSEDIVYKK